METIGWSGFDEKKKIITSKERTEKMPTLYSEFEICVDIKIMKIIRCIDCIPTTVSGDATVCVYCLLHGFLVI